MAKNAPLFDPPVTLTAAHELDDFRCGEEALDVWLRERALANTEVAASRTYVVCPLGARRVIGFYALAMGQILNAEATGAMRRNMPRQIPAVILGRLAIDKAWQGKGVGPALLNDAVTRALRASKEVSARLLIMHAISAAAEAFDLHHGFTRLPVEQPTLALDLVKFEKVPASK